MEPIRVEYKNRAYTVGIARSNPKEVLIRDANYGNLLFRGKTNGGNYSNIALSEDGQILSNDEDYGWVESRYSVLKHAPEVLGLALTAKNVSGNEAKTFAEVRDLAEIVRSAA